MTMPASSFTLIELRDQFTGDGGSISLDSQKMRDGAGKGTGNIAMLDFANRAWGQGREVLREETANMSTVKPYHRCCAVDNTIYSNNGFPTPISSGLPQWGFRGSNNNDYPISLYSNGYFYCRRPGVPHKVTVSYSQTEWQNGVKYVSHEIYIGAWSAGPKQGTNQVLQGWTALGTSGTRTLTFTPSASRPWIQVGTRAFMSGGGGAQSIKCESRNMRVYV